MAGGVVEAVKIKEAARRPPRSGSVPVGPAAVGLGDGPIRNPSPTPGGLTGIVRFPASRLGVRDGWGKPQGGGVGARHCGSRCNHQRRRCVHAPQG